jgi:hypothetical protein
VRILQIKPLLSLTSDTRYGAVCLEELMIRTEIDMRIEEPTFGCGWAIVIDESVAGSGRPTRLEEDGEPETG